MRSLVARFAAAAAAISLCSAAVVLFAAGVLASPGTLPWFNAQLYPHLKDGRAGGEVGPFTSCQSTFSSATTGVYCTNGDVQITHVNLQGEGLSGTLPTLLAQMTAIVWFDVRLNEIGGTIPTEIAAWTLIKRFYVHYNALSGTLPTEYTTTTTTTT